MPNLEHAKALTVTFLTPVSIGSLNGSDKEADNVSSIKKLTRGTKTYPYVSSQALRRALRDQLGVLGYTLSEGQAAKEKKGAAITECKPEDYIDDDLFGFMDASKAVTHKRTSPVRVSPLLALDHYEGDLDFGTNYMSVEAGGTPNIFETEIHGGLYRGTVLIELDAVGKSRLGEGVSSAEPEKAWELKREEKAKRVIGLLDALQHLWSSGRQTRFLADISPKFVAAAATTAKVPIFLETVQRNGDGGIDTRALREALADAKSIVVEHCFGARSGLFSGLVVEGEEKPKEPPTPDPQSTEGEAAFKCQTVGQAFATMKRWVNAHYGISESEPCRS